MNSLLNNIIEYLKKDKHLNSLFLVDDNAIKRFYCVVQNDIKKFISEFIAYLESQDSIIHYDQIENNLHIYLNDGLYLIFMIYEHHLKITTKCEVVFDKLNLTIPENDTLTNKEFSNNLSEYFYLLLEYLNARRNNNLFLAFNMTTLIINKFIIIYRAFFDSYNAKKEYKEINVTMNNSQLENLEIIFKSLKFENTLESVLLMINMIDQIIKNLPIVLLKNIDVGFYNNIKKQIYDLN